LVRCDQGIAFSLSVDDGDDLGCVRPVDFNACSDACGVLNGCLCGVLLINDLGINDGLFVRSWKFYHKQHEACNISISGFKFNVELSFHFHTNQSSVFPVLRSWVLSSLLKDYIGGDLKVEFIVVLTGQSVELRKALFDQLVLESEVELQLESFLSSSLKGTGTGTFLA
jgi:hypothetical protein